MVHYFPRAIALAEQLAEENGSARFIWTTGSWLIHEYLRLADEEGRVAMEQAIAKGYVTWLGLPFTTHTELLDAYGQQHGTTGVTHVPEVRTLQAGKSYKLEALDVVFASDVSIMRLKDVCGKVWADECHRLGLFQYETFGVEQYYTWFEQYVSNQQHTYNWADSDFGKPGMELCQPSPIGTVHSPIIVSLQG